MLYGVRNTRHHGFTQEEIRDTPGGVEELSRRRYEAAKTAPPDPRHWNTGNKNWGGVWFTVSTTHPYQVIAGLEGCLDGIVIATWPASQPGPMNAYGEDFVEGKVFTIENPEQWQSYVREANSKRHFDTRTFQALLSRGRDHGFNVEKGHEGELIRPDDLRRRYER
jgi:hypothetical protein